MKKYWNDESGAAAAEYVLILAIIGASIATAAIAFGNSIGSALSKAGSVVTSTAGGF